MITKSRLGNDVCSIIDNFIFHDLYKKVMTELLHCTQDLYLGTSCIQHLFEIIKCKECMYYWTWYQWGGSFNCRYCLREQE